MKILVTGAAGFIGAAVSECLLSRGDEVVGVDNLNDYYDVGLKQARLARLQGRAGFSFQRLELADTNAVSRLFAEIRPLRVVHLAAQAGVRYSLRNPHAYVGANLAAFVNVLEGCRNVSVEHLVFASSSSVYGASTQMPFSVHNHTDHPVSLYGATKKSNELMAHAYSHLFDLPVTGLRFFTVYGPWGRPDMSLFLFTRAILAGEPIEVYNQGDHQRDFTYIDDIVEGVVRVLDRPATRDPTWSSAAPDPGAGAGPYRLYNIGSNNPVSLLRFIEIIETTLGRKAQRKYLPMQSGDVQATWADVSDLVAEFGYAPKTRIEDGVARFVAWYRDYYRVN